MSLIEKVTAIMKVIAKPKSLWHDFVTSGINLSAQQLASGRVKIINILSLVGVIVLISLGTSNILSQGIQTGSFELLTGIALLANILALRRHQRIELAARILMVIIAIPLTLLLITGGESGTGIFWFPTFPVAAYLILGKRTGSTALLIMLLIIFLLVIFETFQLVELAYSFVSIRQMILSLLVLAVIMYIHENLKEEARQDAKRLARSYDSLVETAELREEFTSVLAHELRNPLVAIQKITERWQMPESHLDKQPRSIKYVGLIKTAATDMLHLVNDLLDVASLDSGKFGITTAPHDLHAVITGQISLFQEQARGRDIAIRHTFDTTVPAQPTFDSFRLKQVITNLLSNALKHTAKGETISVQVMMKQGKTSLQERAKERNITWYAPNIDKDLKGINDHIVIAISHPEAGIPPEDLGRLFHKFGRVGTEKDQREALSTGLGLYIVKGVIEAHGGRVGAGTEQGHGVTFYVTFPASPDQSKKS